LTAAAGAIMCRDAEMRLRALAQSPVHTLRRKQHPVAFVELLYAHQQARVQRAHGPSNALHGAVFIRSGAFVRHVHNYNYNYNNLNSSSNNVQT
jgi:hypothetical protein